jgi:hypothetical protein
MFICPPNLTHSFHTVAQGAHKVIRFKVGKKVFFLVLKGHNRVLGAKKTYF